MERKIFFRFRDHLRCVVNGKPLLCKACNTHIRFDPVTQQELRHRCGTGDLPELHELYPGGPAAEIGDPADTDWDDDIGEVEDPLSVGERIAFAEDVAGYGEDLREFTDMRPRGEW